MKVSHTRCRPSARAALHGPWAPPRPAAVAARAPPPRLGRRRAMVLLRAAAPAAEAAQSQDPNASMTGSGEGTGASVVFSNDVDPQCTVITMCGRNDTALLMQVTAVLNNANLSVGSANINADNEGQVCDIFRVTDASGAKLSQEDWPGIEAQLMAVLSGSSRSSKPTIFGRAAEADTGEIKTFASQGDTDALEQAANDMAQAALALVSLERDLIAMTANGADAAALLTKQTERLEASSALERRMAAMEAILTSRRQLAEAMVLEPAADRVPDFMAPPPVKTTGPAAGDGYEIIFQGFNWESCKEPWYAKLSAQARELAEAGFTAVWLPPHTDSVSPQGYLPRDLYCFDSRYGSEAELRGLIAVLHEHGIKAIADIVINHRCAHYQGEDGKWNKFGGRLAWDKAVICANNPAFGGGGSWKNTEDYTAAPNLDHSQERVRKDIAEWMRYMRNSLGFDGWRFDFVKGYEGRYVREYIDASVPAMAFGEYWDTCSYTDGVLNYNQDAHRQRTVDWVDATGATGAAFDFTTKAVLQEALGRKEYWRLIDGQGRPPGVIGIWPSRAITFLENHDTGSTLQHWPFPWSHLAEGYAYILTHPGTPCVFYDHFYFDEALKKHILELMALRKRLGINYKSEVLIRKAYNDLYAAVVDKRLAMKMGPGNWSPNSDRVEVGQKEWVLAASGPNFAVWEAVF